MWSGHSKLVHELRTSWTIASQSLRFHPELACLNAVAANDDRGAIVHNGPIAIRAHARSERRLWRQFLHRLQVTGQEHVAEAAARRYTNSDSRVALLPPMQLVRRFLVVQALMLWQGGFVFYAAVVVPTGTDVLGSFPQGRVTRHVTDAMNLIGMAALAVLAWDQFQNRDSNGGRRLRWAIWASLAAAQAALFLLHSRISSHVDFAMDGAILDYWAFYLWHRIYLCVAAAQWAAGVVYVAVMLRAWNGTPRSA
jgi:hypothetical protein